MDKFAVDLDKVLDEFELNEDKSYNETVKNCNDIITPNYVPYNINQSKNINNNVSAYLKHPSSEHIQSPNQNIIDLEDADFAPSSKTTNQITPNGCLNNWQKFVSVSNQNNFNNTQKETEPDVVQVSVPSSTTDPNSLCTTNGSSDANGQSLPDVMVISSPVISDTKNNNVEETIEPDAEMEERATEVVEPVGFTNEKIACEDVEGYLNELEELDEVEEKAAEVVVEVNVASKTPEVEGSIKRQIDEIDGCTYNTGARPKKSLMYTEKVYHDTLSEVLNITPTESKDLIVDSSAIDAARSDEVCVEQNNLNDSLQINKDEMLPSSNNFNEILSENFQTNVQFQDATNVNLRRQRPTSLNLPPLFNLGLPKVDNCDAPSTMTKSLSSENVVSNNNIGGQQQPLQRPSVLQVAPLNALINKQPPGHTPGDILGIPDLCHHLENSSVPEESKIEAMPPSPSISNQSNGSISASPIIDAKTWPTIGTTPATEPIASSPVTSTSTEDQQLGRVAPFWVPDASAANCMLCDAKFTVIKRRHHCRACGKVLCAQCCSLKAKIQYMDYKDARVCQPCSEIISRVNNEKIASIPESNSLTMNAEGESMANSTEGSISSGTPSPSMFRGRSPNPNNPDEYCSTVPPLQQAQAALHQPPPTVMVPVGVLKRQGTKVRGEPKQVIFSDGIRPGGDLTELDGSCEPFIPSKKSIRTQKKLIVLGSAGQTKPEGHSKPAISPDLSIENPSDNSNGLNNLESDQPVDFSAVIDTIKDESADPISFAVNKNLVILIKIVTLDCCVNKVCWCFTTKGMCTIGQDEIVIVLECLPDENEPPMDIFRHLSYIYEEASKGIVVSDMGHSLITQSFLGSKEHGGFLFIKPTFQCLNKLILPPSPYLFGILLVKWEAPWAKVFPMRLMLRLGAEFRYYPCPLISVRSRKPVFCEIGHTIMNVLVDFRNYQYGLPSVRGMVTVMEDKKTYVDFPRNRYDEVMKALNNSNDHVLALSSNFSMEADSHLVCVQNDEGHYQTQAINIQNKARKVTGASFVVFNGALKSSLGLSAKSSIVEDGLMVQISSDTMLALRQSLRDMQDFTIGCGPVNVSQPEELVYVRWVDDDKNLNIGVRSVVDGMEFDGVQSIRIHSGTDYMGDTKLIRWTEVFLIKSAEDGTSSKMDPIDINRLSETLAQACCIALTPHLDQLIESDISKIGLRVTINSEKVEYEVGANEERLPDFYMNDLDSELVPVIHRAVSNNHEGYIVLELVFYILQY